MLWAALAIAAVLVVLVFYASRYGRKSERLSEAEDELDAVDKAKQAEAGVDALTAASRRDKLREWTR